MLETSWDYIKWKVFFLAILIMCSINFFELQVIKSSLFRYIQFGYLMMAVILSIPYIFFKKSAFVLPVQLIFFSVVISLFIPVFTRGQSFVDSLGGSVPILVWGVFFYLNKERIPIFWIENLVISFGLLYLILYFFQFTHPETGYFIKLETIDYSRGILRIVFPGRGLFYLTIFIAINKITTSKQDLWFWIFLSIIGIVVTVMQVTRQFMFGAVIIYLIHFLKDLKLLNKLIVVVLSIGIVTYIFNSDNLIIASLKDTQEQNQELGSDYVRVQGTLFYLFDFSNSMFSRIFGNGVPYGEKSDYNKYYAWLLTNYGYWLSDVGLVAIYAMFGVFAVLGYFLIWLQSFIIKLPKEFFYLKYYLWFLLMTCLTSDTIYSSYDLIATVLVLYIYQTIYEEQKVKANIMAMLTVNDVC